MPRCCYRSPFAGGGAIWDFSVAGGFGIGFQPPADPVGVGGEIGRAGGILHMHTPNTVHGCCFPARSLSHGPSRRHIMSVKEVCIMSFFGKDFGGEWILIVFLILVVILCCCCNG